MGYDLIIPWDQCIPWASFRLFGKYAWRISALLYHRALASISLLGYKPPPILPIIPWDQPVSHPTVGVARFAPKRPWVIEFLM